MTKLGFRKPLRQQLTESVTGLEHYQKLYGLTEAGKKHVAQMRADVDSRAAKAAARKPRQKYDGRTEADIQSEIIRFLLQHPAVAMVERINSGAVYGQAGNFIKFHHLMLPVRYRDVRMRVVDLSVTLTDGRRMVIECKRGDWTKPGDDREREQANYLEHVRMCGGIGIFATSIDDVREVLDGKERWWVSVSSLR